MKRNLNLIFGPHIQLIQSKTKLGCNKRFDAFFGKARKKMKEFKRRYINLDNATIACGVLIEMPLIQLKSHEIVVLSSLL